MKYIDRYESNSIPLTLLQIIQPTQTLTTLNITHSKWILLPLMSTLYLMYGTQVNYSKEQFK